MCVNRLRCSMRVVRSWVLILLVLQLFSTFASSSSSCHCVVVVVIVQHAKCASNGYVSQLPSRVNRHDSRKCFRVNMMRTMDMIRTKNTYIRIRSIYTTQCCCYATICHAMVECFVHLKYTRNTFKRCVCLQNDFKCELTCSTQTLCSKWNPPLLCRISFWDITTLSIFKVAF